MLAEFRGSQFPDRRKIAADYDALAARLAEAERLMAAAMRNGDFVSDNVLYVYGDDFNAMARFLGRTLREICAGKADSASAIHVP
jgi:hypothetical protein